METKQIADQMVTFHRHNTVIVGAGAAGMNCAVHLYEYMRRKGVRNPQDRIVVITGGLGLGASRMSGSDKQTYYKMGTSPDVPDNAYVEGQATDVPTVALTEDIDITGCGDSALCAISVALSTGASLTEAAQLGNMGANVTIRKLNINGTSSPQELIDIYNRVFRDSGLW